MGIPLNIDWQQILLHLLNFVILAGGLYLLLFKPVKGILDKRREDIAKKQDDAEKIKADAMALRDEYEQKLADAEKNADEIRAAAIKDAEISAKEICDKAEDEAEALKSRARTIIEKEHRDMIDGAKEEIAVLATEAARKIAQSDDYSQFADAIDSDKE